MKKLFGLLLWLSAVSATPQRLPGNPVPVSYKITFTPDLRKASFTGEETIQVRVEKPTSAIILNAVEIEFRNTTITAAGKTQPASVTRDQAKQMATLAVPTAIPPGEATLHIEFSGILNDQLRGFYLSKGRGRNYAATQFESTDARRAFPSFDEPAFKATFDLTLVVDMGDTVISNGNIISDVLGPGEGKHSIHFSTTPKMSSYLLTMAVGDWQCSQGVADAIPIRICSTPDKINLTGFALASAEQILKFYNRYFDIRYPYGKLDVLAIPDFEAGAMENTAAIFYRETLLLIDDQHASVAAHKNVAEVLAHEIAHQWFGDLVTMQWWDDIWLNEGFATWMTPKPVALWKPDWKEELSAVESLLNSLTVDARQTTRAVRQKAETPEEINELFDGIAYGKAAAVLRMIERYVGSEVFRKGTNHYLQAHAYGNAKAEDFWNAVAAASGKPVNQIMPTFVDQPGEPLVTVKSSCSTNITNVTLSQQRFFASSATFGSAPNQVWQIPVCMRLEGQQQAVCRTLDQRKMMFPLSGCSHTLFANAGGTGYYRTQYAAADLAKMNVSELKAAERLSLVGDQWALVRAAQTPIGDYLNLVSHMKNERESFVLGQILAALNLIGDVLVNPADQERYRTFVSGFLSPLADDIGLDAKSDDSDDRKELRSDVLRRLGHTAGDRKAVAKSRELVERYLRDRSSVDPSLIDSALAIAAENGDSGLYDRYLAARKSAKVPEQFYNFQRRLVSFKQPELVMRTLEFAASPDVRNQDATFLIAAELSPQNQKITWLWIKEHWEQVQKQITASSGAAIVGAAGGFCDPQYRDDVQQFFREHKVPSAERTLRQTVERINSCIDLREHQQQNLSNFLNQQH